MDCESKLSSIECCIVHPSAPRQTLFFDRSLHRTFAVNSERILSDISASTFVENRRTRPAFRFSRKLEKGESTRVVHRSFSTIVTVFHRRNVSLNVVLDLFLPEGLIV